MGSNPAAPTINPHLEPSQYCEILRSFHALKFIQSTILMVGRNAVVLDEVQFTKFRLQGLWLPQLSLMTSLPTSGRDRSPT